MKNRTFFTLTIGQTLFLIVGMVIMIVGSFYLGSKFGGKIFGDYSSSNQHFYSLLPDEITDEEIKKLNEEIKLKNYQFHQILESDKSLVATIKLVPEKSDLVVKNKLQQEKKKEFIKKHPPESSEKVVVSDDHQKEEKVSDSKKMDNKTLVEEKLADKKPLEKEKGLKDQKEEKIEEKNEDPLANLLKKDLNSSYTLILGRYNSEAKASKSYQKFKKDGYSVRIEEVLSENDEIIYQLRVGRYPSQEAAIIGQKRFKKLYLINPEITTY